MSDTIRRKAKDMLVHPGFSTAAWEKAPQYWGPGTRELQERGRVTVLDFNWLEMIAESQQQQGAFRGEGYECSKAPIKLGDIPAAFLRVVTETDQDFDVHTPTEPEVLVVINGILTVKNPRLSKFNDPDSGIGGPLKKGHAIALKPGGIFLKAHGAHHKADSLVLAILGVRDSANGLIIAPPRGQKWFNPEFKPVLPYTPKPNNDE